MVAGKAAVGFVVVSVAVSVASGCGAALTPVARPPDLPDPDCVCTAAPAAGLAGSGRCEPEATPVGAAPAAGPPSEASSQAMRLYSQEHYQDAAPLFQQVVDGATGDAKANRERAEFFLAKCLYHDGRNQDALRVFAGIARHGPEHLYFAATLQWLAQLGDRVDVADVVPLVGRYRTDAVLQFNNAESRDLYDRMLYLFARARSAQGCADDAAALLTRIRPGSAYCAPAIALVRSMPPRNPATRTCAAATGAVLQSPAPP